MWNLLIFNRHTDTQFKRHRYVLTLNAAGMCDITNQKQQPNITRLTWSFATPCHATRGQHVQVYRRWNADTRNAVIWACRIWWRHRGEGIGATRLCLVRLAAVVPLIVVPATLAVVPRVLAVPPGLRRSWPGTAGMSVVGVKVHSHAATRIHVIIIGVIVIFHDDVICVISNIIINENEMPSSSNLKT